MNKQNSKKLLQLLKEKTAFEDLNVRSNIVQTEEMAKVANHWSAVRHQISIEIEKIEDEIKMRKV